MRIKAFSSLSGLSVYALRHYESQGLLLPSRLANGYRDYAPEQAREAVFIAMSREVGIPLHVIAEQLPQYRVGKLEPAQIIEALLERRDELGVQIAALQAQQKKVVDHAKWIKQRVRVAKAKTSATQSTQAASKPWPSHCKQTG